MWFFKSNGVNFKSLQYPLHNDTKDCVDAAQVIWCYPERATPFLLLGLPFLELNQVKVLVDCLISGQIEEGVQSIRCNKIIKSQREWLTQVSHKIKPLHYETYKSELPFQRILGTGYRWGKYSDYLIICGRTLLNPLASQGWKHEIVDVAVIGKDDWYLRCDVAQYPKYLELVYELHNRDLDMSKVDQQKYFQPSEFWSLKDAFKMRVAQSTKGTK